MAKKEKENGLKKTVLSILSFLALIVIGWLLFFGKTRLQSTINPFIKKVPKNEEELVGYTDNVLGKAAQSLKGDGLKKAAEVGSDFFENSQYAEPARGIREEVKKRADEVLESIKQLPAKELQIIKMEIYKKWFAEMATQSASQ